MTQREQLTVNEVNNNAASQNEEVGNRVEVGEGLHRDCFDA